MAQQIVNIGIAPNTNTGDPIRIAFTKINDNFTELYTFNLGQTAGSTTQGFVNYSATTKTAGQFYGGTTAPDSTIRLNFDGYFYATRLYGDGSGLSNITTIGDATASSLSVTGNLTVNGTTTTVNSTTVTLDDPILTLGGDTAPTINDSKDRGIEFRWHNGTSAKLGFFGFDDSTGKFTFIPDATNTSEVFSGTPGILDVSSITGSAAKWTTGRTLAITGDVTYTSPLFDGTANVTAEATLATVNSNVGSFGSATAIPVVTVNGKGLITAISTTAVSIPSGSITFIGDVTGTGTTGSSTTLTIANGAVSNAKLANSTISGVSLGSNLNTLTMNVSGDGLTGSTTYNGSTAATFTVTSNATSANTASAIVARDASGNFSTGAITLSDGTANGVLYLNGSKVATSGSALTFDGTNLGVGDTSPSTRGRLSVLATTGVGRQFVVTSAGLTQARYDDNSLTNILTLQNYGMTAASHGAGILWSLGNSVANAANAGSIQVLSEGIWGATTASRDSAMAFFTTLDGNMSERMRIDSVGNTGFGTTASGWAKVHVGGTYPSSTNYSVANYAAGTIPSASTTEGVGFWSELSTQATTFSTTVSHFVANQGTFGAGSTVTSQHGFRVSSNLTGATNNYGFYSNIASGTGRWNFYANGTATNYLAGSLFIGSTNSGGTEKLFVEQSADANTARIVNTSTSGALRGLQIHSTANNIPGVTLSRWYSSFAGNADIGQIRFDGLGTGGGYVEHAAIYATATGANTATGAPTKLSFKTSDGTSSTEKMALSATGVLSITSNVASTTTTTGALVVTGGVGISGALNATTKSFIIVHPTKPGKLLKHGSLEGPEFGVYVRGKLKGTNVIELPEYWTKLVDPDSITVNLTPIGRHQDLYVEDIVGNKVIIRNGNLLNKEINCYYTVFAERIDVEKLEVEIE